MYYAIPGRAAAWRRFYRQHVKPGDLCFDIGAHAGNRTGALLAVGARVIAVEPQPLFARTLRRIYGRSPKFTLAPLAVGRQPGNMQMFMSSRTPTVSTMSETWMREVSKERSFSNTNWDQREIVKVITLDGLIAEHGLPLFCKLDIEGYELEALQGLSQAISLISFEYLPPVIERSLSCLDHLLELGKYQFNIVESEYPKFALEEWVNMTRITAHLRAKPRHVRSGEVYARLTD